MKNYTTDEITSCLDIYRKPTVIEWIIGVVVLVLAPIIMLVAAQ